jgi:uncharacterized membrane protein YdjX (TVP38/TMEM64 family)
MPRHFLRRLPLIVILVVAVAGVFLLRDELTFAALAARREALLGWRDLHPVSAPLVFMAVYAVLVGFSLPGGLIATLTGGFLFGLFPGLFYNVLGAGTGAVAVFLAARAGLGADVAERVRAGGGAGARLMAGLEREVWPVLFVMRLVPAVPFFLANLIPAFTGVRLVPYAVTTFLGIIPGALVYTSVGAGLGQVFAEGRTPDLGVIFAPHVLGPILGLAALSALPMVLRRWRRG